MAYAHILVLAVTVLALLTVIGIVASAPSLAAGIDRLKLIFNTVGLAIVGVGIIAGTVLLAWGLLAGSKELIYISFVPFIAAGLTYGFITRRHATWYGMLGFNDSAERWRSFWDETRRLWGLAPKSRTRRGQTASGASGPAPGSAGPGGRTSGPGSGGARPAPGSSAAPAGGRSFSFSFNLGGGSSRALGPLAMFAAHRLASDRISVFPTALHFVVVADEGVAEPARLASLHQELTVRRDDGGLLAISVATDLDFLDLIVGGQAFDGSYPIAVALRAERPETGSHSGIITIETGDAGCPQLQVPVAATIR